MKEQKYSCLKQAGGDGKNTTLDGTEGWIDNNAIREVK
jgi:hypothetical protein